VGRSECHAGRFIQNDGITAAGCWQKKIRRAVISVRVNIDAGPLTLGDGNSPFSGESPLERFFRRFGLGSEVPCHACFAARLGGVSGGKENQGWRDSSHTAMVGAGKFGSAKLPIATATTPGKPSFSQ
jgi:hypothetical protein